MSVEQLVRETSGRARGSYASSVPDYSREPVFLNPELLYLNGDEPWRTNSKLNTGTRVPARSGSPISQFSTGPSRPSPKSSWLLRIYLPASRCSISVVVLVPPPWAASQSVGKAGQVVGVDVSTVMIERARERATEESSSAEFLVADAQVGAFARAPFDRLISRFGVMFFDEPVAAFSNLRDSAAPEGTLTFVCWQSPKVNPWIAVPLGIARQFVELPPAEPGAPGPFAFADPERVRGILTDAGWRDVRLEPKQGAMRFGDGSVETVVRLPRKSRTVVWNPLPRSRKSDTRDALLASLRQGLGEAADDSGQVALGGSIWIVSGRRLRLEMSLASVNPHTAD